MNQNSMFKKILAVTHGDPYGIGPEVAVKAIADESLRRTVEVVLFGSLDVWGDAIDVYAPDLRPTVVASASDAVGKGLALIDTGPVEGDRPDRPCPTLHGGAAALTAIYGAVGAANAGLIDALVTAPISKEAIGLAGCSFPGHTELLAHEMNCRRPVMLMVGGGLRVALVTIHLPLRKLPLNLTSEAVLATIRTTAEGMTNHFGLATPRIAVCGLNPHAGEGGRFGREEGDVIAPAIQQACDKGIDVTGPFAADSLFYKAKMGHYDAVIAMYHDQGLIPVKLLAFDSGVNMTLGLPIIRTSPDHGTAFDIAGQGKANSGAMCAAIDLAIRTGC